MLNQNVCKIHTFILTLSEQLNKIKNFNLITKIEIVL